MLNSLRRFFSSIIPVFILTLGAFGQLTNLVATNAYANVIIGSGAQVSLSHRVTADEFSAFISNYKGLALFIAGICAITAIVMFIVSISKLSVSAENDQLRRKAWAGIITSGVALALLGGISVVIGIFWHILE